MYGPFLESYRWEKLLKSINVRHTFISDSRVHNYLFSAQIWTYKKNAQRLIAYDGTRWDVTTFPSADEIGQITIDRKLLQNIENIACKVSEAYQTFGVCRSVALQAPTTRTTFIEGQYWFREPVNSTDPDGPFKLRNILTGEFLTYVPGDPSSFRAEGM